MGRARVSRSGIALNASPQTHERVLSWFAVYARGRVFDCPAGGGALTYELAAMGFAVVAADIDPRAGRGVGLRLCADLRRPLPFAGGTFDYVACVEGIEHLERPVDALREMRRLLRPGGRLVRVGFSIERLEASRTVRSSVPWAWLVGPIGIATHVALRRPAHRATAGTLLSRDLLFGHALLFACRAV